MRVLMFGWEFPPHISGGLGTACFGITSALLNKMIKVLFVVPHLFGAEDQEKFNLINTSQIIKEKQVCLSQQPELSYFKIDSPLRPYLSPDQFLANYQNARYNTTTSTDQLISVEDVYGSDLMSEVRNYTIAASSIATEEKFDVIHAHDWLTFPAAILAKQLSGKPLVVHVHATEFDRSGQHINPKIFKIEKEGMLAADKIIAVSLLTKHTIIENYGIANEKIDVIHNGIGSSVKPTMNIAEDRGSQGDKIVSFLGRVTFQKGPDYFVEAARKVLDRLPNVHFVIAGTGDMLYSLMKRVAELRMSTRFHFIGFVDEHERDRLFAMTHVYVMPSVSEPFGLSALEAMQAGVPIIISKQSGVSEVVTNALKIDFWDTDALANAIFGLLEYSALRNTFKRENEIEIESISWNTTAEKIINIYKSLI
jgi:glycogen(starch) synthase